MFVVINSDYEEYIVTYVGPSKAKAWEAAEAEKYGYVEVQEWQDGKAVKFWYYEPARKKWE